VKGKDFATGTVNWKGYEMSRTVFIAYMNETGEFVHYLPAIKAMMAFGLGKQALRIAEDLRTFAGVCYQELLDIVWNVADAESGFQLNFVSFTNEGARCGRFRCFDTKSRNLTYGTFRPASSSESLYQVTPLANPENFSRALDIVANKFDPATHEYYLVTKAHGNSRLAMTSLMSAKLGLPSHLLESAIKMQLADQTIQASNSNVDRPLGNSTKDFGQGSLGQVGLGQVGLGEVGLGAVGLGEFVVEESEDGIGTTKEEYLEILGRSRSGSKMKFRAVVMESCNSKLSSALLKRVPTNVEKLFTSSDSLRYSTLEYNQLLQQPLLPEKAMERIVAKGFEVQQRLPQD
jgi:hypothetical protein